MLNKKIAVIDAEAAQDRTTKTRTKQPKKKNQNNPPKCDSEMVNQFKKF
jgi:hypothetical protein